MRLQVNSMRKLFVIVFSITSLTLLPACSRSISADFEAGMNACSSVGALDMLLQSKNTNVDYPRMIDDIVSYANNAAELNLNKYSQLALLANTFQQSAANGEQRSLLDLVALEGECSNLGLWMN